MKPNNIIAILIAAGLMVAGIVLGIIHQQQDEKRQKNTPAVLTKSDKTMSVNPTTFAGFSWVRKDQLAGMPLPGAHTPLEQDLSTLESNGIDVLISLTETPTSADEAESHGIELVHIPVRDFTAPTQQQLLSFIEVTQASLEAGKPVGVHCQAGHGRTGTFLAAWFIHEGKSAEESILEIRTLRPGSVETASQEQALYDLETHLRAVED